MLGGEKPDPREKTCMPALEQDRPFSNSLIAGCHSGPASQGAPKLPGASQVQLAPRRRWK